MSFLGSWIFQLSCAALLVGCTAALAGERWRRLVRFVGGLLLCVVLLSPVVKLDPEEIAYQLGQYRAEYERYADRGIFPGRVGSAAGIIIADRTRAYIMERAAALGIDCDVEVTCLRREEGYPYPASLVGVYRPDTDTAALRLLQRQIEAELGIEEQEWTEKN